MIKTQGNFYTIFVNDSEQTKTYKLQTANMVVSGKPPLELWKTRAADVGAGFDSNYLRHLCNLSADASGAYSITVKPYSIVTATTLANSANPELSAPLPVEGPREVLDTDATGAVRNTMRWVARNSSSAGNWAADSLSGAASFSGTRP